MTTLLHDILLQTAAVHPERQAVVHGEEVISYHELASLVDAFAAGLINEGLERNGRVAVYLPKRKEGVASFYGATRAGGVFVPVNPVLKAEQVMHILRDCNVQILVTSPDRLIGLEDVLARCVDLKTIVLVDGEPDGFQQGFPQKLVSWNDLVACELSPYPHEAIDTDMAAIFYTSGSTGNPKGVVLSHRNMVAGCKSVATYLANSEKDRLLAVLPFSFDYGFSQLSTAFSVGACVILIDYLFPRDVVQAIVRYEVTGLAAVPPLWIQLAELGWPESAARSLRYVTNSGGAMPKATLEKLRSLLPETQFYLMYGLTEAFRSTYLPPEELDQRPDSIGKAIPNVQVEVINAEGEICAPGEPGELVHRRAGQFGLLE